MSRLTKRIRWFQKRIQDGLSYRFRTFAGGRFASLCRPTSIAILLTERCNARCVHCNIWQNRGPEDSPSPEQWSSVFINLRRWLGPAQVCVTGGEALLYPYAVDLIEQGVRLGLFVELLTNGFCSDQKTIERLALADPWRITLSLDGLGTVHDRIRGRDGFFTRTEETIRTLLRIRREKQLAYSIRLKTVVMSHNLEALEDVARFANRDGMDVLYQPIEQNYSTAEDPGWYRHSDNWPADPERAVTAVDRLIRLKHEGLAIANTVENLDVMKAYFRDPAAWRVATQAHTAHEKKATCAALGLLQIQANGDVRTCCFMPPVGNIKTQTPRAIWKTRPKWWISGCCMERRMTHGEPHGASD
ncbi:MAG TPA: hypothetical protein DD670_08325 [Planctomycetaceae bacterium]|nr:hypothetical protein [Planctomycetaceae bacterium]